MKASVETADGRLVDVSHIYAVKQCPIGDLYFVKVFVMIPQDFSGRGEWVMLRGHFETRAECAEFTRSFGVPLR